MWIRWDTEGPYNGTDKPLSMFCQFTGPYPPDVDANRAKAWMQALFIALVTVLSFQL